LHYTFGTDPSAVIAGLDPAMHPLA
jgi:hypothetical protein